MERIKKLTKKELWQLIEMKKIIKLMKMMNQRMAMEQTKRKGRLQYGDEPSYFADFMIA